MRARFISSIFMKYWLVLLTALMLAAPVHAKGPVPGGCPKSTSTSCRAKPSRPWP
jgi:ribonuclease T1